MEERNERIETGWNLDNSYADLPKLFFSMQRPTPKLSGAVLTRVADSHMRVGTFQYAAEWGQLKN